MAFGSDIAKLLASLDLDTRPFQRGARSVDASLGKMEGGMGRVSTRAIAFGSAIGVGIERLAEKGIDVLFDSLRAGEEGLHVLQDATAQTNAVIESTGGAAGQTAASVRALAEELENLTTADDKAIQQGENLLLTFTSIGEDVFPDATKAMVNMAIAMNKGNAETADFDSAAVQLGKALQDPIKGITALRRVGVNFTEDQEKRIKNLVEEGKLQEAQGVILKELGIEFGKAGEAAGKSEAAGLRRFHDAIEDIQISLASGLSPALDEIRAELTTAMNDPQTQQAVKDLGVWLGEAAKSGLAFAKSIPWGQVADGLKTAAGFAGKLIDTFAHLPPGVQGTIIALAGLNKLTGGGVIKIGVDLFKEGAKGLLGQFFQRGASPAAPMFTKEIGLPAGAGGTVPVAGARGGIGTVGKFLLAAEAIGLIVAVNEVKNAVQDGWREQTTQIGTDLNNVIERQNPEDLRLALSGIDQGIAQLDATFKTPGEPPQILESTYNELVKMRADTVAALQKLVQQNISDRDSQESKHIAQIAKNTAIQPDEITKKQKQHFDRLRDRIETQRIQTTARLEQNRSATDRVRDRVESARIAVQTGTNRIAQNTMSAADRIVATLRALNLSTSVVVNVSGSGSSSYQSNGQYSGTGGAGKKKALG